jgi:hypothetical protein
VLADLQFTDRADAAVASTTVLAEFATTPRACTIAGTAGGTRTAPQNVAASTSMPDVAGRVGSSAPSQLPPVQRILQPFAVRHRDLSPRDRHQTGLRQVVQDAREVLGRQIQL